MGLGRAKVVEMRARVEKRIENFILVELLLVVLTR